MSRLQSIICAVCVKTVLWRLMCTRSAADSTDRMKADCPHYFLLLPLCGPVLSRSRTHRFTSSSSSPSDCESESLSPPPSPPAALASVTHRIQAGPKRSLGSRPDLERADAGSSKRRATSFGGREVNGHTRSRTFFAHGHDIIDLTRSPSPLVELPDVALTFEHPPSPQVLPCASSSSLTVPRGPIHIPPSSTSQPSNSLGLPQPVSPAVEFIQT